MRASLCYNRFPDEKGTERLNKSNVAHIMTSYNRFPDEKGTESYRDG